MKIYLDVVIFINFFFDFFLLFGVDRLLKRNTKLFRIILGSIIGGISILFLFIPCSSFILFIGKIIISILMVIVTFSYHNIKYFMKNVISIYVLSIFLGGFLYFINDSFSYKNTGIIFFHNGFSINIILIIVITPFIVYFYIKNYKDNKKYNNVHNVDIYLEDKVYSFSGFLDTGNNLVDPYKKRGVIIVNKNLDLKSDVLYVPFKTISDSGVLKCYKTSKVLIDKTYEFKNLLVGVSSKATIDGIDCILPNIIKEEIL